MSSIEKKIAFKFDVSRMLELLSDQIYQSPLALLRENTQNAFDAIRMRQAIQNEDFEPVIKVTLNEERIIVSDNGIGMTADEIESNFWYAGQSGKNTQFAQEAGVVGTFGIGAMANFGVADELSVESESALDGERTLSSVRKAELSMDKESITLLKIESKQQAGTTVQATLSPECNVSVPDAINFLREFVEFVEIPVIFNGELLSGAAYRTVLPSERSSWSEHVCNASLAGIIFGDLQVLGMASGELRIVFENVGSQVELNKRGSIILLQGRNVIRTLRFGFGLATVAMQSVYQWGGIINLPFLKPIAGREALDASSNQLLQKIMSALDQLVSPIAAEHAESFTNDGFLRWIVTTSKFELCGPLEITPRPFDRSEQLSEVIERSGVKYYSGRDESVVKMYASTDEPLIVLARRSPRRDCELGYLRLKGIQEVDAKPRMTKEFDLTSLSFPHSALATRIARVLEDDYFLHADIRFGNISGGLPVFTTEIGTSVILHLDPNSINVAPLLALYRDDFDAFGPFVKDFIRSIIFPRISHLVPSSTREGSEAFLRHLRSNREWFEYEFGDKANLEDIFTEVHAGRMSITEAKKRLASSDRSFVEVSSEGTASLASVIREPDSGLSPDDHPDPFSAIPSIDRREEETKALILTSETPINGYHCFLAISDRVQREKGHFFLQPHSTDIVWGGRKVVFVFQHHAKRFGLYYDILCPGLVGSGSGGGPKITATILTKNRTFIPIPNEIVQDFLPEVDERKRLEIRCDVLYFMDR